MENNLVKKSRKYRSDFESGNPPETPGILFFSNIFISAASDVPAEGTDTPEDLSSDPR